MHTSKLLIGLTLAASIANAQGTKKKMTVAQNTATPTAVAQADLGSSSAPTMTASPATQTSVADAAAAKPVTASKFGVSLAYETTTQVVALKNDASKAPVDAVGAIGLKYALTDKIKTELRHNFAAPIVAENSQLAGMASKGEGYLTLDPTIHANVSTDMSVLGSKPLTIASRYYIPVTQASIDAGSNGVLRTQTSLDWDVNPKISLSAAMQARLYLISGRGTSPKADAQAKLDAQGSDSKLRMIPQLSATYNFSDAVNAYYSPYADLIMSGHQRGNFSKADLNNELYQEIGANVTVGALTINPAWATKATGEGSEYVGFGEDSQSEYYLNFYASF